MDSLVIAYSFLLIRLPLYQPMCLVSDNDHRPLSKNSHPHKSHSLQQRAPTNTPICTYFIPLRTPLAPTQGFYSR